MADRPATPQTPGGGANRAGEAISRAAFALANQRPTDAERIAGDLLQAEPGNIQALHIYGRALLMQGRARDAVVALERVTRSRHDPEIDTLFAIALRQAGRPEDALARLRRATKRQPPHAAAFHELGSLLCTLQRYDEAIEALRRAIAIAPMMPELSIRLGFVFLQRRNFAGAKIHFARALEISPDSFDALFGMAKAHQEVGENAAAAAYFRRCLAARPAEAGNWLNLGHCLLELGEREAGYECFRTAARGDAKRYGEALASLVKSGRGRFWLKPSEAAHYLRGKS
jgi:Tfp pilus assembly protein PilF